MPIEHFPFPNRKEVVDHLKGVGLKSGDILFRASEAYGPFGIPFSYLVEKFTNSKWTHMSLVRMRDDKPYVFEITDRGTLEYRLIDWLDYCKDQDFSIYRLKNDNPLIIQKLEAEIDKILEEDPDYDFNFKQDDDRFYCVEGATEVYRRVGIQLIEPSAMDEIIDGWKLYLIKYGSKAIRYLTGAGFDFDSKFYFVGNEHQGVMSSPLITPVLRHNPLL